MNVQNLDKMNSFYLNLESGSANLMCFCNPNNTCFREHKLFEFTFTQCFILSQWSKIKNSIRKLFCRKKYMFWRILPYPSMGSKIILDYPINLGWVPNQKKKIVQKSLIWTWPKCFGPDQTNWTQPKSFVFLFWMGQYNFGLIEGQGINGL